MAAAQWGNTSTEDLMTMPLGTAGRELALQQRLEAYVQQVNALTAERDALLLRAATPAGAVLAIARAPQAARELAPAPAVMAVVRTPAQEAEYQAYRAARVLYETLRPSKDECKHWSKAFASVLRYAPINFQRVDLERCTTLVHESREYGRLSEERALAVLSYDAGRRYSLSQSSDASGWVSYNVAARP